MSEQATEQLVLRKTLVVAASPERAFEVFTAGIAGWWPMATHSTGKEQVEAVVIEPREGGRFYERLKDGTEQDWGIVTAWEPPERFASTWHPGYDAAEGQDLEVRFTPEGDGTRVDLVHTGWERRADAEEMLRNYDAGWDVVLGERFAGAFGG
jgi:uncharacterized protein YndB with AHSA1/START domain